MPILNKKCLSKTEEDIVAEILRNPNFKHYLEVLAYNTAVDLAYCAIEFGEDPNKYIHKQQFIKGQLDLLDQLAHASNIAESFNSNQE